MIELLLQVTVAVVRYTSLLKERLGVASTHLAERMQVRKPLLNARCIRSQAFSY